MLDTIRGNSASSLNGSLDNAGGDAKALVKDAQSLLNAAAALTGTKADERCWMLRWARPARRRIKQWSRAANWRARPMSM
jgi:hypothetical protein